MCLNKIRSFSQAVETASEAIDRINNFNMSFVSVGKEEGNGGEGTGSKKAQTILLKLYYRKAKAF